MKRSTYMVFMWTIFFIASLWLWYHGGFIANMFSNLTQLTLFVMVFTTGIGTVYYLYKYIRHERKEGYGEKIDSASFDYQMNGVWSVHM